ncbi:50S ribosomal protein L22 [Weissella tructae]|jgi:large subunit ribosomal protein L22|uniref:Large ribosomal subunit protein uL22 n=2 Tax=Weissella TaxID=46255 RepID=A0A075U0G3_9LACO|nr:MULTISPECIES: 50S ribosomal protein L22 [Weissella]AIG66030.1 50S ribosomal protein L22 [Weissella tructae]AIM63410.1 50S ribosomal protein L22 [Weissella ceti]AIM64744.1 50S ribosomal protein L22 [Weissella ceti]ELA07401.1 50S ribosomal protein L22 [Weissella ceti NC36]QVV91183.1 50S ribosomal protein L22 [Weissella tructae]
MAEQITSARATANTVRVAPRKVRLVLDQVRGKSVAEAFAILEFLPNHSSVDVYKVLNSAVANAENNFSLDREDLVIAEAFANEGPTLKRFRPRAKGSASAINKRTSHITIVVTEK